MQNEPFPEDAAANFPRPELRTRRALLQLFGGAPLLPMAGASLATLLTGCGEDGKDGTNGTNGANGSNGANGTNGSDAPQSIKSARFVGMAAPSVAAAAALGKSSSDGAMLELEFADGSTRQVKLGYTEFFVTGDSVPKAGGGTIVAGGYFRPDGTPIEVAGAQVYSDCVDGSSLFKVPGSPANTVHAVVQFEYQSAAYGAYPSPIAVLTLKQNPDTGHLTLVSYHNVDTSGIHGLWIPCGGSLSPWGTHLSSEEYMPDAFDQGDNQTLELYRTFIANAGLNPATASPYHYGHLPEVTVNAANGTGTIRKYYNLGRYSRELVQVFPDNKTVLGGDDTNNGALFMFVADSAGNLSSGTLYAAKYVSPLNETTPGDIKWIKLGHASSSEIETLANDSALTTVTAAGSIKNNGIFYSTTTNPGDPSYTEIKNAGKSMWVRLVPGQEKAAAFLETHRYAALKGASMVFTKMEGTTVNKQDKMAYSAISAISGSLTPGNAHNKEVPLGGGALVNSLVGFAANSAGMVLMHALGANQTDTDGNLIASDWVPYQTSMLINGMQVAADAVGNTNDVDGISCPDNLKYSEKLRTLFIGEDSGNHVSNFVWAYELDTGRLLRVLSAPAGAECTGLQGVDDLNGWTYILSGFQHAGEYTSGTVQAVKDAAGPGIIANYKGLMKGAAIGYVTGTSVAVKLIK
ncbi:MAG: DUF839 domain-containing protein [Steroidobacteraceae bacterium]